MIRKIIPFTTEEAWLELRKHDLTSSDVPCLFGCGYISEEELKNNKKTGTSQIFIEDERKQWGLALQDAIANEFARRNQWTIRKKTEYIRIPDLRIGSSFDFEIKIGVQIKNEGFPSSNELLEIKNIDSLQFKNKWLTTGFEIEASPYIEIQVQHQMLVSGVSVCYVGALIGGNKGVLLRREANAKVQAEILKRCERFWKDIR